MAGERGQAMSRLLMTILFCLGVYALSLLALLAVQPIADGARALGGPYAGYAPLTSSPHKTAAAPLIHAVASGYTAGHSVPGAAPPAPSSGTSSIPVSANVPVTPATSNEPPAFWLLPLPPDLLVTALILRRLWRGRRAYGAAPAWRLS